MASIVPAQVSDGSTIDLVSADRRRLCFEGEALLCFEPNGIHQTMVGEWKRQAMEDMAAVFSGKTAAQESARAGEAEVEKLHAKIGQLLVERDFLAKAFGR